MLSGVIKLIQVFNFFSRDQLNRNWFRFNYFTQFRVRKLCACQGADTQECEERHR